MTFNEYWQNLVRQNTALRENGSMKLSCASFREQLQIAWVAARQDVAESSERSQLNPLEKLFQSFQKVT